MHSCGNAAVKGLELAQLLGQLGVLVTTAISISAGCRRARWGARGAGRCGGAKASNPQGRPKLCKLAQYVDWKSSLFAGRKPSLDARKLAQNLGQPCEFHVQCGGAPAGREPLHGISTWAWAARSRPAGGGHRSSISPEPEIHSVDPESGPTLRLL